MLNVNAISFAYDQKLILDDVSFSVKQGDHLAVVGESGSGKTTLLQLIYGKFDLDKGAIHWKENAVLGPSYNLIIGQDYIKYVAQEFELMPYTSVRENIGKHLSNFFLEKKEERITELLEVVELEAFGATKVQFLSGGQKQRVALAQAIAKEPEIILLDEPFSHIDNYKKQSLRRSLFNYLKKKNITCIIATHDKEDVLPFSNQMLVLHESKIIASGQPEELYKQPKTPRIASFFGEFNVIEPFGIVYASQIKLASNGSLTALVNKSYFKGSHYLIEAQMKQLAILFEHRTFLEAGTTVHLSVQNS